MNYNKLRWYWSIFVQVWKLFKKHHAVQSDEEWKVLMREATMLKEKYNNENFPRQLIMLVLEELDKN